MIYTVSPKKLSGCRLRLSAPAEKGGKLMKERIAGLRQLLGLTQQQFADQIGVKRGTIANYELGRNIPTKTVRKMICMVYSVRPEWLENGEGEMFEGKNRYDQAMEISGEYMNDGNDSFRRRLVSVIAGLSEEQLALLADIAEKIVGKKGPQKKHGDEEE